MARKKMGEIKTPAIEKITKEEIVEVDKPITEIRVCGQKIKGEIVGDQFISDDGCTYAIPE